jgi:hypothetical protein
VLVRRYCGDHPHHYGSYVAVAEADVIELIDRISSTVALFFLSYCVSAREGVFPIAAAVRGNAKRNCGKSFSAAS